jgi:uncharacterized membrane protein
MAMDELSYRNIWISFVVSMVPTCIVMVLFWNNEEARGVVSFIGTIVGLVVLNVLDQRERRRNAEKAEPTK